MNNHVHWKIIDAIYWLPATRKRVYIVCFPKELNANFQWPKNPIKKTCFWKDIRIDLSMDEWNDHLIHNANYKYFKKRPDKLKSRLINYDDDFACIGALVSREHSLDQTMIKRYGFPKFRNFTIDEKKSLLGFPKDFILGNDKLISGKQLGNSIAVPVIKSIGKQIVSAINSTISSSPKFTPYQNQLFNNR